MNELIKISEVALKYDLTTRALRYYEDAGLIESVRTDDYAYRMYDEGAIKRIEQILVLRKLNISIKDIKRIFSHDSVDVLLEVLEQKINEIDDEATLLNQLKGIIGSFIRQLEKNDFHLEEDLSLIYKKINDVDNDDMMLENAESSSGVNLVDVTKKLEKLPDVRIVNLPRVKMARSGDTDLEKFDSWWSGIEVEQSMFPRDFMWYNPRLNCFEWLFAIPENLTDTNGYEVFDFPGGLYAVATAYDEGEEIGRVNGLIHKWVELSEEYKEFTSNNSAEERYDMGHVISPMGAKRSQMDLFIPIVEID